MNQNFCSDADNDGSWQGAQTQNNTEAGIFPGTAKIPACCGGNDCQDSIASVHPGILVETCDGYDSDCDGRLPADELDKDKDGRIQCDGDCNDLDKSVYGASGVVTGNVFGVSGSAAPEICDNKDNNCACGLIPGGANTGCVDGKFFKNIIII